MAQMTRKEVFAFLGEGTRTAHVASVRADGRPHVKPMWFVVTGTPEEFSIELNTGANTVKGRTLARDSRVALTVDDPHPSYSYVIVEGIADLVEDLDQVRAVATRIGGRYMGEDRAEEFGARNGVPGELLVRVTPTKVIAERDLAD
jgi:PPOX class probable F420-dependent enzyme